MSFENAISVEDRNGELGTSGPANHCGRNWVRPWPIGLLTLVLSVAAGLGLVPAAAAYDFTADLLTKGQEATQTNSGLAVINAKNGYVFDAKIVLASNSALTNGSILLPAGLGSEALTASSAGSDPEFSHKVNKLSTLNTDYPDGAYTLTIEDTVDGLLQPVLQLTGSDYPPLPHLDNFSAAQAINANGYFNATWDAFTGGSATDFVQLHIEDLAGNKIWETPDVEKEGALDGTATNAVIPPGVLNTNQTYNARIQFQKAVTVDWTNYPGALSESGYFTRTTFTMATTAAVAPEVEECELAKANKWIQTGTNSLILETGHEYSINATVEAYNPGILSTGAMTLPPKGASSRVLAIQSGNTELAYTDVASNAVDLDSLYGTGTYSMVFPTPDDGAKSLSFVLPADNYPPAPVFANFDALQFVDITQPFTIAWNPWVGGSANDLIVVRIEDHLQNKFFQSGGLGENGALDGTATSIVIPTNTLPAGQTFEIHVTFIRFAAVNTAAYPGVLLLSDFQTRTKINTTTHGPAQAAVLGLSPGSSTNQFQLSLQVLPGFSYRLDGSSNLLQWFPLSTNTASSYLLQLEYPATSPWLFFRSVTLP
jgi:hypothetical protein